MAISNLYLKWQLKKNIYNDVADRTGILMTEGALSKEQPPGRLERAKEKKTIHDNILKSFIGNTYYS